MKGIFHSNATQSTNFNKTLPVVNNNAIQQGHNRLIECRTFTRTKTHTTTTESSPPSLDSLIIGTQDQITSLSKHAPLILPNQSPDQPYAETLQNLRNTYNYTYVINWLYNFRGFLKLQLEYFDVDIFELELLNYFPKPSTYDNDEYGLAIPNTYSVLFIDKLKLSLIHSLMGSKESNELKFEQVVRQYFGISTPLGGIAVPTDVIEIKEDGDDIEQSGEEEKQQDAEEIVEADAVVEADDDGPAAKVNKTCLNLIIY